MAFRRFRHEKRKLMLFPLMDMFFILLLFFLINIGVKSEKGEKAYTNAVPNEGLGKAQILLQMVGTDRVLWLDNTTFLDALRPGFPQSYVISSSRQLFSDKFQNFHNQFQGCLRNDVLTVIRCPDDLDYGAVEQLQDSLSVAFRDVMKEFNLKFSIVPAGPLENIVAEPLDIDGRRVRLTW